MYDNIIHRKSKKGKSFAKEKRIFRKKAVFLQKNQTFLAVSPRRSKKRRVAKPPYQRNKLWIYFTFATSGCFATTEKQPKIPLQKPNISQKSRKRRQNPPLVYRGRQKHRVFCTFKKLRSCFCDIRARSNLEEGRQCPSVACDRFRPFIFNAAFLLRCFT